MSSSVAFASKLAGIARTKLNFAVGCNVKDNGSLHRWVLLKNSIVRALPSSSDPVVAKPTHSLKLDVQCVYRQNPEDEDVDDECEVEEEDAFVFPDPGALLDKSFSTDKHVSEAQWLDSLLESLSDDMGDDTINDSHNPMDDEDDTFEYSPSLTPNSSSEDLVNNAGFYQPPPPIAVPYPIPYPPLFHPPLIVAEGFDRHLDRVEDAPRIEDGLPYYDVDDLDDLSVPEAIEDTSDDESETLTSPFSRSGSSFTVDPASIPLPPSRQSPRVYIGMDDHYLYHFHQHDPLPFAGDTREYDSADVFQEC